MALENGEPKLILGLHGFTAVAELKEGSGAEIGSPGACLHGFTAVAELKAGVNTGGRRCSPGLHGFTAVAELKA